MKATGIVRKIDELGRIVIPKEIRRTMKIREGDPLEIFTEKNGEVIFKKYSPLNENFEISGSVCEALHKHGGFSVCVFDGDTLIAHSGFSKKEAANAQMSEELEKLITSEKSYFRNDAENTVTFIDQPLAVMVPIRAESDIVGALAAFKKELPDKSDEKLVHTAAAIIGKELF